VLSLFRRHRLPAAARPPLSADERVLAWAGTADEGVVIVTNLGLWLPGAPERVRLGWHEIHKATWTGQVLVVVPAREVAAHDTYVEMADADPVRVSLPTPDKVPEQVRARVTRSVAYTSHHAVPGGGVRIVARRVPGVDGVSWTVRYDPGTAAAPDAVASLVAHGRAALSGGGSVTPAG
jgi:hypothetical protein